MITNYNRFINENADLGLDEYNPQQLGQLIAQECTTVNPSINRVEELINAGADVSAPLDLDSGITALHAAAHNGHLVIVKILLKAGAPLEVKDNIGKRSVLSYAAQSNFPNIIKTLLDAGAKVDSRDNMDWTPLHVATYNGYRKIVKILINAGADLNAIDQSGSTPLYKAARRYHSIVKILLDAGASKDIKNYDGRTPWDIAPPDLRTKCPELKP